MSIPSLLVTFGLTSLALTLPTSAQNGQAYLPTAAKFDTLPLDQVALHQVGEIDRFAIGQEDLQRRLSGLPPRYAIPNAVSITPFTHGSLEGVGNHLLLWRLRVLAPHASSINFGFTRFVMPEGGQLMVYSADQSQVIRPFTADDNEGHGELWTPPVMSEHAVIELTIPSALLEQLELELTHIGYGYRGFGSNESISGPDSGSCNVDVVCPDGDDWQNEIPSVGVISTGGSTFCTGFMVNNTANDQSPLFMTANHCGIGGGNAASLVVFWNFETSVCGGSPDGQLNEFNTGSTHLASSSASDFTIVLLDDDPDPDWGVTFAGWDRSSGDFAGAVAIHHPNTDEKRISYEFDGTTTTTYLQSATPGNGTHIRIEDWDTGTTEGGSSGSPLFNMSHQVIGQLHGGFAACGNNLDDWYGRISVSWNGGGSPSSRLSDWLDPLGTGAMSVNTLGTLAIPPSGTVFHEGPSGGPFTNPLSSYTLNNGSTSSVDYTVSLTEDIGFLINGGTTTLAGTLIPGASLQVDVTLGAALNALPNGSHTETIVFTDVTNGVSSTRTHTLAVGRETLLSFPLDTDPGWLMQGEWAFGVPTGNGGSTGFPDPTSGATGSNVLGYDLNGDYANNLSPQHLFSDLLTIPTGATGLRVRFERWLNVETSTYDDASFSVRVDGGSWMEIWKNPGTVSDSSWVDQEFDISAIADGASTLRLRWTMGATDGSVVHSGWNIDDIEITGVLPASPPPPAEPERPENEPTKKPGSARAG